MNTKKIIPCVYLHNQKLIKGFKDTSIVTEDPVAYITNLAVNGADSVIVFDLSSGDEEHEKDLLMIRKITKATDVAVIGAGNVKRLEDVKKLIYAGCKKVALNMAKQSNIDLIEEAGKRFSKQKILVCADAAMQILDNLKLIKDNSSACITLGKFDMGNFEDMPLIVLVNDNNADIKDILNSKSVEAVSGDVINSCSDLINLKLELKKAQLPVELLEAAVKWDELKKDDNGLVPVVVQDLVSSEVLMVAYMNEEAYNATLLSGIMTYYSRSRKEFWKKGDTSGHYQYVKELSCDCDKDTILAKVIQIGSACHTGSHSCFFNEIAKKEYDEANPYTVLEDVMNVILDRKENPKEGSYTNYLFDKGIDKILKKVGEEATEIIIAAKNPEPEESKYEIADFLYHVMVLMALKGITWEQVMEELANR